MATRVKSGAVVESQTVDMIPADEHVEIDVDETESEETELLRSMQTLLAESETGRVYVKLYRIRPMTKKWEWCEDIDPDQMREGGFPMIRTKFGAGDYKLRLIGPKGVVNTVSVSIASDAATVPMQGQHSQVSEVSEVLRTLAENQARMMDALTNRPQVDPMAQMSQMFAMMGAMREAMGLNNPPPVASASNPLELVREAMATARELKTAAAEMANDKPESEPEDDSLIGIIKSVSPLIQSALTNQGGQPAAAGFPPLQPMQLPPSIENGAHLSQHAKGPEEMNPQQNPAQLLLLGIIEDLCDMAKAGKSPTEGAEFALDSLPDDALPVLRNRYGVQAMALQFPIIKPHEEWFGKVRTEAVRIMDEPEPEADPAG